jgi:RND family efflux transporter MFP subunit
MEDDFPLSKIHGTLLSPLLLWFFLSQWSCSVAEDPSSAVLPQSSAAQLEVTVSPVKLLDWKVTVPVSGTLLSQSIVEVRTEVAGRLVSSLLREGDYARKSQLIAEIDSTNYSLVLDQAKAALAVSQASLEHARVMAEHAAREKERADNLLRSGGITEKDHQAASTGVRETQTQVRLAEAQLEQARAAVAVAEKSLRDCRILAPVDGQVQRKFFDTGSLLDRGSPLYTLVNNINLDLDCMVPAYRLAEVRLGQKAVFTTPTWGDRNFEGVVSAINPMVETDNRSVKVRLKIANPGGDLRSGMFAKGEIQVRLETSAMTIPRSALLSESAESSSASAFVAYNGKAQRRPVVVGGVDQDRVWIREGLRPEDQVIVEIGPALKEGTSVRVLSDSSSPGR